MAVPALRSLPTPETLIDELPVAAWAFAARVASVWNVLIDTTDRGSIALRSAPGIASIVQVQPRDPGVVFVDLSVARGRVTGEIGVAWHAVVEQAGPHGHPGGEQREKLLLDLGWVLEAGWPFVQSALDTTYPRR